MALDLDGLTAKLPPNAIVWRGSGTDWMLNLSALTDDVLEPTSGFIEPLAQLLQCVNQLVYETNQQRANAEPPLAPIALISKTITTSASGNPVHNFTVSIEEKPTFTEVVNPAA